MFQQVLLCFTGFCAGIIVAGGVSGLLIGLSIVPRYAGITHTANHIFLYEDLGGKRHGRRDRQGSRNHRQDRKRRLPGAGRSGTTENPGTADPRQEADEGRRVSERLSGGRRDDAGLQYLRKSLIIVKFV